MWKYVVTWLSIPTVLYAAAVSFNASRSFTQARLPGEVIPPLGTWICAGLLSVSLVFIFVACFCLGAMLTGASPDMVVVKKG